RLPDRDTHHASHHAVRGYAVLGFWFQELLYRAARTDSAMADLAQLVGIGRTVSATSWSAKFIGAKVRRSGRSLPRRACPTPHTPRRAADPSPHPAAHPHW